jgi:hypothetical protein
VTANLLREIVKAKQIALTFSGAHEEALREFATACASANWKAAEMQQEIAIESMRSHLDAVQAIWRLQQNVPAAHR